MHQFRRARSIFNALLIISLLGFISAPGAQGRLNLPQLRESIHLPGEISTALRDFFSRASIASELPLSLQSSILHSMPKDLNGACSDLMEAWAGEDARASAVWQVRLLHRERARVWLAFHCASSQPHLADYHDERLGFLRLDTDVLEIVPLSADTADDDEIHQIDFVERVSLSGAEGFSFRVKVPQNPCCDGPETRLQERLMIFADSPAGLVESLSAITSRDDLSHCDDPEVDTETTYRAEVEFARDSKHIVASLSANFHEKVTDTTYESGVAKPHTTSEHSGTLQFRWNPATFKFVKVQ